MSGQLQVRQGATANVDSIADDVFVIRWGPWVDVVTPGWLFGYVLPNPPLIYEFRYAPEDITQPP